MIQNRNRWGLTVLAAGGVALLFLLAAATVNKTHTYFLPDATCGSCHGPGILQEAVMRTSGDPYIGSDACEPCHTTTYHIWSRSSHCRTMMCAGPTTVMGNFSPDTVRYSHAGFVTKMVSGPAGYTMIVPDSAGVERPYPVELVVGIRDQQAYLTKFPDGRYQVLPTSWDIMRQTWFDAKEGIVLPEHAKLSGGFFEWTSQGRTWNSQCFNCHLSGMEKNYDPATDTYDTKWRSLDIDCESCHGPGHEHSRLRTVKKLRFRVHEDTSLVRFGKISPQKEVEICAQCHAHKEVLALGYEPGDNFYEFYEIELLDQESVMPDGRFAWLTYNVLAMMQSPCYTKGEMTCTHCHDGHGSGRRNDIRPYANMNDMCRPCHNDIVDDPKKHTFHKPDGTGSDCRACHMQVMNGTRLKLPDHTLSIPVPENTRLFGSPNACTECHADSTVEWAIRRLDEWYGPNRRDRWTRAEVLWKAKQLDPASVGPLAAMLSDTSVNFIWRASAARFLGQLQDDSAVPTLLGALEDRHPMIRWNAVHALNSFEEDRRVEPAVKPLLHREPNSQIRLAVAALLGYWWRTDLPPREKAIAQDTWEQFVRQINTALSDDPRARRQLGDIYLRRGQYASAEREFKISLRLQPNNARAESGLAELYDVTGQYRLAVEHYRTALELDPGNAGYHVNLGVTLANLRNADDAVRHFRRAIEIEPTLIPARVNLGQALMGDGRPEEAYRVARDAVKLDSSILESQYLLGMASLRLGRKREAAQSFVNVLALAPSAPFAGEIRGELAALIPVGERVPQPRIDSPPRRRAEGPRRVIRPREVWPLNDWPDHTPRTTQEQVWALGPPPGFPAALDSARNWVRLADYTRLSVYARRAYAERTIEILKPYMQSPPHDAFAAFETRRLTGHAYAILSSVIGREGKDSTAALAAEVLGRADTAAVSHIPGALTNLGKAYYRLARSYNEVHDWAPAIPAYALAAKLVPGTFTEAISYFFIGTSYDRLGEREEALAMYRRSAVTPNNSQRGYRCARHLQAYTFTYVPPLP